MLASILLFFSVDCYVRHDSVSSPLEFIAYTEEVVRVIGSHGVDRVST
jgi:hypothetical protein